MAIMVYQTDTHTTKLELAVEALCWDNFQIGGTHYQPPRRTALIVETAVHSVFPSVCRSLVCLSVCFLSACPCMSATV